MTTRRGENQHFVHVLKKPATPYRFVPTFAPKVASVALFGTELPLNYKQQPGGRFIYLDGSLGHEA